MGLLEARPGGSGCVASSLLFLSVSEPGRTEKEEVLMPDTSPLKLEQC